MKKNFWKKPYGAIALIMALVLGFAVNPSLAYFTDYTTAAGTAPVALEPSHTEINAILNGLDKQIQIKNTGTSEAFVRLRIFYPALDNLDVKITAGAGWVWEEAENCWIYTEVLKPQASTTVVQVDVDETKAGSLTQDFQIVVVHESVQALYDGDHPDWNLSWSHGMEKGE